MSFMRPIAIYVWILSIEKFASSIIIKLIHNRTSVLIQWVSKRVSGFYLQKPLFTRVFLYHLTKTGSAVTEKWSPRSLFAFLRRNLFMKGPEGVRSRKRNHEKAHQVFEWEDIALSDPINKCAYR